jgi:hypothetical protein
MEQAHLRDMPSPSPDDTKPVVRKSRSRSTLARQFEGEQDISTLLMLGAAEARNCKADLEDQVNKKP